MQNTNISIWAPSIIEFAMPLIVMVKAGSNKDESWQSCDLNWLATVPYAFLTHVFYRNKNIVITLILSLWQFAGSKSHPCLTWSLINQISYTANYLKPILLVFTIVYICRKRSMRLLLQQFSSVILLGICKFSYLIILKFQKFPLACCTCHFLKLLKVIYGFICMIAQQPLTNFLPN